ncbi:MAG: dihydrofolate reductase [Erysipelotrichaceae bacterium]|nr:dihydrofolate reductase [Erysipelotrichaceae bacterium]
MKAIAAVDQNWAIGNNNQLLVHIPDDMKNFRRLTQGKTVIYGRKTLETFPHAKPLPKRDNIILSRNPDYFVENAKVVHSVEELKEMLPENTDDYIVIGGDSVYHTLLPLCDTCIITKVENSYKADAWFDNLDNDPAWQCIERGEDQEYEGLIFHFDTYERI